MQTEPVSSAALGLFVTLGNLAVWLGLGCAVLCLVLYWVAMVRSLRQPASAAAPESTGKKGKPARASQASSAAEAKTDRIGLWARRLFYATSGCFIVGAICLWALIFRQDYLVQYVWKNSNSHLPLGYRFASFWSNQEGTFLLWGLYNTALGSVFIWKARSDERWVMPFFTLVNVSLFALLVFMNPFWLHSPEDIRRGLGASASPEMLSFLPTTFSQHVAYYLGWGKYWLIRDGKGLNESLQNFWMVIHPPTLFVGYSSMMVPAACAMGALMRRDYDSWVVRAMPWLMFSWTILGLGIFLGAYWAYETLGWGGYWSWDPVENSSILPWVVGTALIHGLVAQRNRGNYKQANLFLGLTAGTMVFLSSFLVRSGVLSETSVHAFASPQGSVFATLAGVLVLWFVASLAIWIWRFKDIQGEIAYETTWERHFGFFLGMIVLSATAVVITFGVFFVPVILTKGFGAKMSLDFKFYNQALVPVMFVTVLLMALTPLMPWRRAREEARPLKTFDKVMLGLVALTTVFFMVGAVRAWLGGPSNHDPAVPFPQGVNDLAYLPFGILTGLALVTTFVCMARARRGGWLNTGPWVAHAGFLIILFGVVFTSRFNRVYPVEGLKMGEVATKENGQLILDREWRFIGERPAANPQDRDRMLIEMKKGSETFVFDPKIFISKQNEQAQMMAWPVIKSEGLNDVYVSPNVVAPKMIDGAENLAKEKPVQLSLSEPGQPVKKATVVLQGLDMSEFQKAVRGEITGAPTIYAEVDVTVDGQTHRVKPGMVIAMEDGKPQFRPAGFGWIPGTDRIIAMADLGLNPQNVTATLVTAVPTASFQILYVPGIQILWWGCYLMIIGAGMCFRRRSLLARRPVAAEAPAPKIAPRKPAAGVPAPEPAGAE